MEIPIHDQLYCKLFIKFNALNRVHDINTLDLDRIHTGQVETEEMTLCLAKAVI